MEPSIPAPAGEAGAGGRARRWRAVLLGALAAAAVAARAPRLPCGDYCTYHSAGRLALDGRPAAAYDPAALREVHRTLHPDPRGVGPWLYSPVWLAPVAALAALPHETGERFFGWLAAAGLGAGLAFVLFRLRSAVAEVGVAVAFALSHPAWIQLVVLNLSWLLFALVAAAWWAAARHRAGVAGLAWALAVLLKPFVGLALVALWVTGRREVVARAAVLALFLSALALPLAGAASWARYAGFLGATRTAGVTPYYNKLSLQATIARFQSEPRDWVAPRAPVATPAVRALFWVALPFWALGLRRLRRDPDAALAFTLPFLLLAVPQVWDHTEILLFAVLPALPHRHAVALAVLLGASFFYNALQQPLLHEVLRREKPPFALQSFLLYFPAANLLALGAALASRGAATGRSVADARAA